MSNTVAASKIACGLLVGGGLVGGGVFYSMHQNAPISAIEKRLNKEGKKFLNSNRQDLWEIKLHIYKNKLTDRENINLSPETWQALQSWCQAQSKSWTEDTKVLAQATKICTVPNLLEKLNKDSKDTHDSNEWAAKLESYRKETNQQNVIKSLNKDTVQEAEFKNWCWITLDKDYEDDNTNDFPLVEKWCVK